MNELPLELKIKISANFYPVWFFFATNDDQFIKYANSPAGVRQCIESFRGYAGKTGETGKTSGTSGTTLFGRLHSFAGRPVYDYDIATVYYYNGEYHREDGGPAIVAQGRCHWLKHGKYYRADGLPHVVESHFRGWYESGVTYGTNGKICQRYIHKWDDDYWIITINGRELGYYPETGNWEDRSNHNSEVITDLESYEIDCNYHPATDPMWLHDIEFIEHIAGKEPI